MYELEYLYEQLKAKTTTANYLSALNSISEATYNVSEAKEEVDDKLKEIEEGIKLKKKNLLDKRRSGFVTAKKLLSKFKATSKKSKPYGLSHREFATFKTDEEIKKLHENAVNYLNCFDPKIASDTEVKLFISDISDNVQYKALNTIFGSGNDKCSLKSCTVVAKETKELTKQDIEEAITYLENFNEDSSKYVITREAYNTYGLSPERKMAANYKTALLAIADARYYDLMSQKLTLEFAQAAQVVQKASYHNPRNLRESREVQDYIDFLYEYGV